jgi:uncharacterized protein (DUF58 family)
MPTRRGWTAVAAGLAMWVAARLVASPDLHAIAAGVVALPLLGVLYVRWTHSRMEVHRSLSAVRAAPGARVTVTLTIGNRGRAATSFLLLEDAVPPGLGKPARLVAAGIPPRNDQRLSYTLLCRQRGRYVVGPLSIYLTDPFGLARARVQAQSTSELVVYPAVEDLSAGGLVTQGAGAGESAVRHLYRSTAEFFTMRQYVTGDDLRRIHWPSVARTGELMIRQDESTRRSTATVFLDTRSLALGPNGSPGFEKAVSVGATLGRALLRSGFALRLALPDSSPTSVGEEQLLETLAGISPSRSNSLAQPLSSLRASSPTETTLALVTAPPFPAELAMITRVGSAFGRRLAVLVYPIHPGTMAAEAAAELEARAMVARTSLQRAGWDVYVIPPDGRLAELWRLRRTRKLQTAATSS